jgi:hypothetical protein
MLPHFFHHIYVIIFLFFSFFSSFAGFTHPCVGAGYQSSLIPSSSLNGYNNNDYDDDNDDNVLHFYVIWTFCLFGLCVSVSLLTIYTLWYVHLIIYSSFIFTTTNLCPLTDWLQWYLQKRIIRRRKYETAHRSNRA